MKIFAATEETVHAQTLKAWIKERMAAGQPVDMDLFAIYDGKKAVIERPKE